MKITLFLTFILTLQVSAHVLAQKVSLKANGKTFSAVLDDVRKQTGVDFLFDASYLRQAKPVTLEFQDLDLKDALPLIFENQPFSYEIDRGIITINSRLLEISASKENLILAYQQVSGRVVDSVGVPLSGAIIRVRNVNGQRTTMATTSDKEGYFLLKNVPENAQLEITFLGYISRILNAKTVMGEIVLQTLPSSLEEVEVMVNTGYQVLKPNEVNGSIVTLNSKELMQQSGMNILERLDGITSGLAFTKGKNNGNPQNSTQISIRGLSTINGPLDPLIVLNGFIYEGDIENINPNDVAQINILKDASAASIWGARAGNGVIVITTHRGRFNQPLRWSLRSNIIAGQKPDLYDVSQISSPDYIDFEEILFNHGYFDNQILNTPYFGLTPAVEVFLKRRLGQISSADSALEINSLKTIDIRDQYGQHFYKSSFIQQHAIGVQGGGEKHHFNLSAALDQNSTETYDRFRKINLKVDHTFRPVAKMSLSTGLYYTNSLYHSGRPSYNTIQVFGRFPTYLSFMDDNGDPQSIAYQYRDVFTDTLGMGKLLDWKYYPLQDYKYNTTTKQLEELFGHVSFNYSLTSYLNLDLKYQYQRQNTKSVSNSDIESYQSRNMINSFSQLNRTTGTMNYIVPLGGIYQQGMQTTGSYTWRGQLNFSKKWQDHQLHMISGSEIREAEGESNGGSLYGYYKDPLTTNSVDYVGSYPHFITGNYGNIPSNTSMNHTLYRFVSFYSNLSYQFKGKYLLSGSARKDGSNIFGANTNDKWKPLWSLGIGWNISDEVFYGFKSYLPYLKFTATYGLSGNVDMSRSALPVAQYGVYNVTKFRLARISTINNPDLRWEQSAQLNLRLEFASPSDIMKGSIEYYIKKGTDLYGNTPYDYTTWGRTSEIIRNIANMRGDGIDIVLNSKNLKGMVKWNTTFLFNYNVSKTTAYFSNSSKIMATSMGGSISPYVGYPLYALSAYKWGGLNNQGDPQGFLGGNLSTDYTKMSLEASTLGSDGNIVYKGSAIPEFFGSIINEFSWNKFTASVSVGYKLGYYLFKPTISYSNLVQRGEGHSDYEKRWKSPGDEFVTNVPSFQFPLVSGRDAFYASSEANVIKGDHIRLNYINLAYDLLPTGNIKNSNFLNVQIYVISSNLGIMWRANQDRIDPDNLINYRQPRSLTIGIRSNF